MNDSYLRELMERGSAPTLDEITDQAHSIKIKMTILPSVLRADASLFDKIHDSFVSKVLTE